MADPVPVPKYTPPPQKPPWKEFLTIAGIALAVMGFVVFMVFHLYRSSKPAGLTGVVIEKIHEPRNDQTVTIGTGGVKTAQDRGHFALKVRVKSLDQDYMIWVDEYVYNSHKVGQRYFFVKPPPIPGASPEAETAPPKNTP